MEEKSIHAVSEITSKYSAYTAEMFYTFEDFLFQQFYLGEIHEGVKKKKMALLNHENVYSSMVKPYDNKLIYGLIHRQEKKLIGKWALIEAVSYTEHFLQKIAFRVYRDFEERLGNQNEGAAQQNKLLEIIINSNTKSEIISKVAEEKIRGIFYGNPVNFFTKDKAKLGFGEYFQNHYKLAITKYHEILARRNIYVHYDGRVDRKYLREVKDASYRLNEKIPISKDYIRESIFILHGLSTLAMRQVIKNTYKISSVKGSTLNYIRKFEKKYKDK